MNKHKFVISTLLSAALFELLIIAVSISPFAGRGNANYWGGRGIIYSLIMVALMYIIPLILYGVNIKGMKYLLAFEIAIFTIGTGVIYIVVCPFGYVGVVAMIMDNIRNNMELTNCICNIVIKIICLLEIICNIIWYIINFSKRNRKG